MTILKLFFAIFFPILLGHSFLAFMLKKEKIDLFEHLAVSFVFGSGLLSIFMTLLILFKIPLYLSAIIPAPLLFSAASLLIHQREYFPDFSMPRPKFSVRSLLTALLCFLILLKLFFVFSEALLLPVYSWDGLQIWALKAKRIFFERTPGDIFRTPFNADYPLHLPLTFFWIAAVLGEWSDQLIKIVNPVYFLCLLACFYAALKRHADSLRALFFTYLLATLPLLAYHAAIEYADLILSLFYFLAAAYLLEYLETKRHRYIILSSIFAGFLPLIKIEGIFYAAALILLLFIIYLAEQRHPAQFLKFGIVAAAVCIPWYVLKTFLQLKPDAMNFPSRLYSLPQYFERMITVCAVFYNKSFFEGNWLLAWPFLVLVLIIYYRKIFNSNLKYIYGLMFINLLILLLLFTATEMFDWIFGSSPTFNRMVMHTMPILMFCAGLTLNHLDGRD